MPLSHYSCSHHRGHILPCWSPIEWRNGYCHCVWGFYSMIVVCIDYIEHTDVVSVQLSHFQVCIGTCKFFHFAFSGLTSNIDAPTKWQYTLCITRTVRLIYYVYSVYLLFVTVKYNEASCGGKSAGQCQHLPNWAPWFGVSWALALIVERLTTPFVCACWCKSRHLGVWNFILRWSVHTNTHLHPICWVTKYHMIHESQLPNWAPRFGVSSGSS